MNEAENDFLLQVTENPIQSKQELQALLQQLVNPLKNYFNCDNTRLFLGDTATHYSRKTAGFEAFSRPLWGLTPLLSGGGSASIWREYMEGIKNGTNPGHQNFWGYPEDYDQRIVEMASFGLALALCRSELLDALTDMEKENLFRWLHAVNQVKTPDNNWHLFKVIVNIGLAKAGEDNNQCANNEAFKRIECYYLGNGWYSDGLKNQKDYYVSFAIHYYCLIYAELMDKEDPNRARLFKNRAAKFARDFIYWFSADGSSIPFGRSMTYRFAQTAFWNALAFANVETIPWGQVKGIVLRHLRWWMQQPIFTKDGLLTIGYGYPNLIMTENYNAPGSPYWAFKSFLVLALDETHPFWMAEEQELPDLQQIKTQQHPQMILCRDRFNKHVFALTSGQYDDPGPAQAAAKYSKFAYSNQFGFSVSKEPYGLKNGAFDSMLALSEQDNHWRVRRSCEQVQITEEYIYSLWKPWNDVTIETWLIPINQWHVRLHRIENERVLDTAEGGFALPFDSKYENSGEESHSFVHTTGGYSGMIDLLNERKHDMIQSAPNTNILHADVSIIPTLLTSLEIGSHWLAGAFLAHRDQSLFMEHWEDKPQLERKTKGICISHHDKSSNVELDVML